MKLFLQICKLLAGGWLIVVAVLGGARPDWVNFVSILIGVALMLMALWNIVRVLRKKPLVGEK